MAKTLAVTQAFSRLRDWLDHSAGAGAAVLAPAPLAPGHVLAEPPEDLRAMCAEAARSCLWGCGCDGPADPDSQADRLAALDPRPGQLVAWIGGGAGGGVCAAADRYGVAIDGYEWRADLLAAGGERVAARDPAAAPVRMLAVDAATPQLDRRPVDAAVSLERLWELRDPRPLLRALHGAMRPGALLIAAEWVLEEAAPRAAALGGLAGARVVDLETWRARFDACRFDLRVEEDGTGLAIAQHRAAIERFAAAFDEVTERILDGPHGKHVVYELTRALNEALQRVAALERGDVAVYRFLAARVASSVS